MTLKTADRVFETSNTTGTGTLTLLGPVSGFGSFVDGVGTGAKVPYTIVQGTSWECGIGTVTDAANDTLSRTTVLRSSNANAAVNFGAGTKNVYLGFVANVVPTRDENLNFIEHFGAVGGTANTLTLALPIVPKAYSDGMIIRGFATLANAVGATTVNVNSLGAKNIKVIGADPAANVLTVGGYFEAVYKSSSGWFELTYPIPAPRLPYGSSVLSGLKTNNNVTDANNDIDIGTGYGCDSSGVSWALSSALTKRLDASFATGTNAGGLFTGTKANSTWYDIWLIRRDSDGLVDCGFDTSTTGANVPAGWTKICHLAWIKTDGSGNIRPYIQTGNEFEFKAVDINVNTTLSTTPTNYDIGGPRASVYINGFVSCTRTSTTGYLYLYNPSVSDQVADSGRASTGIVESGSVLLGSSGMYRVKSDSSGQIRAVANSSSTSVFISLRGWTDPRGKED